MQTRCRPASRRTLERTAKRATCSPSEEEIMPKENRPIAIVASEAPLRARHTAYPEPFASRMAGRFKRPLGDLFGLTRFGVNLTVITPRGQSALRHAHTQQDEFVYVLKGRPTLVTDGGDTQLAPGMCSG